MNSDQTAASIWLLPSVLLSVHLNLVIFAEQKGRAPKTGQTNQCIDDPAEQRTLPAKEPCDQIKLQPTTDRISARVSICFPPFSNILLLEFPLFSQIYENTSFPGIGIDFCCHRGYNEAAILLFGKVDPT